VLERLAHDDRLWIADGDTIADHSLDHHYEAHIRHLEEIGAITDAS
jgi:hypothetical protein